MVVDFKTQVQASALSNGQRDVKLFPSSCVEVNRETLGPSVTRSRVNALLVPRRHCHAARWGEHGRDIRARSCHRPHHTLYRALL